MVKLLDSSAETRIVQALREAESGSSGEIRVYVKRGASKEVFSDGKRTFHRLGMHRTKDRSGVLIFVAWKSRNFSIMGDEGIHRKVGDSFWNETRDRMQAEFLQGELLKGILAGVTSAGVALKKHFPRAAQDKNELPDTLTQGD